MKKIFNNYDWDKVTFKAKFLVPVLILLFCIGRVFTACSPLAITTGPGQVPVFDMGNGKPGASLAVKLNLNEGFKTSAFVNGNPAGTFALINSFKIAMIANNSGTGLNPLAGTSILSITKAALTGSVGSNSAELILKNVPSVTGGTYVAVAAFDSNGTNITVATGTTVTITGATGPFAVSNAGGQAAFPGRVRITAALVATDTAPVTIPLTLRNIAGATIDVTVNDNGHTSPHRIGNGDTALFRFYLVNTSASAPPALVDANIKKGPFNLTTGAKFTALTTNGNNKTGLATLQFLNVPPGTYFVAGAAYSSSATVNSTTNITAATSATYGASYAVHSNTITIGASPLPIGIMGIYSISNTGGDGNGSITVNADLTVSPSASPVVLNIELLP
jgi:hypothetical protein